MNENINKPTKGLHTDNSPQGQPKDTYRFALNAVNETELGDLLFTSNEGSNVECGELPNGYIPLNEVYIGNNENLVFSVSPDDTVSEIGIRDNKCNYTTLVNDQDTPSGQKLNFKSTHQIDSTFRLRRGCERTVYFVDGKNNKPRYFNVDKIENFQTNGDWDANKFELIRTYQSIPFFNEVEVLDSGGQLEPGSYNIAIQYLDENLNPTEWITTSEIINVFNDDISEDFLDIRGSINIAPGADIEDYRVFPTTDKSIKVSFSNLDQTFTFYRLAFIEATSGSGLVTAVNYTDNIPTSKDFYIYTGTNFSSAGTEEEIATFNNVIDSADSIEQIENRLTLGNVQGKQVDFCKLQKYASGIKADLVTKKVLTNVISDANTKKPTVKFDGVGYMPGEIYSFGIVYVFADGTQSPVYHIPGKSPNISNDVTFSPGDNVYPMSNNNQSENSTYTDNSNCGAGNYWGYDSEGEELKNEPVRHHRFPLRSEVGLDFVKQEEESALGGENSSTLFQIELDIEGTLTIPVTCTDDEIAAGTCTEVVSDQFQVRVTYEVDGVEQFMVVNINPEDESNPYQLTETSNFLTSSNVIITKIEESVNGTAQDVTNSGAGTTTVTGGPSSSSLNQLNYTATLKEAVFTSETKIYSTEIYGIKFSGVKKPDLSSTNGEEVIGYYIVRNERDETEKTILDSAVLTPSLINNKYIAHGFLYPELSSEDRISKKVYGLIHPEHKFNGIKYGEFTEMIQEGSFDKIETKKSKARYRDVLDGSSYDSSVHKSGGGTDRDGWSLKAITRDNITTFKKRYNTFDVVQDDVEDVFYLDALQSRNIEGNSESIYNIAGDNKVGIVHLKEDLNENILGTLPYMYLKRPISDPYSTFRSSPYYRDSKNLESFDDEETSVFGGDTYITPMRYVNTMWWDNRIAERAGRTSVWNYILGGLLVVVGALLLIFGGAGAVVIGAGIAVIGGGALFIASGISRDALVKAYQEEYDKGLRETALDDWVSYEYKDFPCTKYGSCDTPQDDEIEWIADCATDLWFESQVNMSLRNGMTSDVPTFIDAPGLIETGREEIEGSYEHFDVLKQVDSKLEPYTKLDIHIMDKLSVFSSERGDSREYIGHCLGEFYEINPDYKRLNTQKTFFHLPIESDCCSDCQEDYPHRVHYSEQSFQEELTDNFRVFLPNNYRDIEGETGVITDLFRIKSNLYIHTEEALWHLPQNFQERITDDIVSFIGTGDYFSIPPKKILDENRSSGGCQHKWATIKTKHGVFFISEKERKVYRFDGNQLDAISDLGMSNWFKENAGIDLLKVYSEANGGDYPYDNNPSNNFGTGYISVYDTKKERLIFTKKDYVLSDYITDTNDFELCTSNGNITLFRDYQATINQQENNGYEYVGLEDCRMKFQKTVFNLQNEQREITTKVPNTADIHIFYDTSGSFDIYINGSRPLNSGESLGPSLGQIDDAVDAWVANFASTNSDWTGSVYKYVDSSERWVNYASIIGTTTYAGQNLANKDIIVISFCNEASPIYHGDLSSSVGSPTSAFNTDYSNFISLYNQYNSFLGIHYPIVYSDNGTTKGFVQQSLAALKGTNFTSAELSELEKNPGMSDSEWNSLLSSLQSNPYPDDGLENYGWLIKENRYRNSNGEIISADQFQTDINDLLAGAITKEIVDFQVSTPTTEDLFIDGEVINDLLQGDNSWTMSFSLKGNHWVSWHSYLPNFYYYLPEEFYSWKSGNNNFWKHNQIGKYGSFYGVKNPYIVEYIGLSDALKTKIWDDITLHTEAKRYNEEMNQYVDERFITFDKAIFYNTRQCSGELTLKVKDTDEQEEDYMMQQVVNLSPGTIIADRNERDWSINDIRDIRVDYKQPIFNANINERQDQYYIDKVLNENALDVNKDWQQLESFRDKYLVVRLIFDNFDDVKLLFNYSVESEKQSFR